MIPKQRKRHGYTWMVLAVLLPVGFLLAWAAIPSGKTEIPGGEVEGISVNQANDGDKQILNINISKPLASPGFLVLLGNENSNDPDSSTLIGQIYGAGDYTFSLPNLDSAVEPIQILIYNPFNQKVTHRFTL